MSVAFTACSRVSAFGRPVGESHSTRASTISTSSSNRILSRPVVRLRRNGLSRAKNTLVGTLQFSWRGRCFLCSDTHYLSERPGRFRVLHKPHARYFRRPIQSARFRSTELLVPRLGQGMVHARN